MCESVDCCDFFVKGWRKNTWECRAEGTEWNENRTKK